MEFKLTNIAGRLFFVVVLFTIDVTNTYCSPLWDSFLQNPTSEHFAALKSTDLSSQQLCNQSNQLTYSQTDKLFQYVSNGNAEALRAAVLISECFDGGNLEDYYRSTGIYFTKHPSNFIRVIYEERVSDNDLQYMVTMLPLSLVDNLEGQRCEINKRMTLLEQIDNPMFAKIKDKLLAYLEQAKVKYPGREQCRNPIRRRQPPYHAHTT